MALAGLGAPITRRLGGWWARLLVCVSAMFWFSLYISPSLFCIGLVDCRVDVNCGALCQFENASQISVFVFCLSLTNFPVLQGRYDGHTR